MAIKLNVRGKLNHAHNKARHRDVAFSAAPARGVRCLSGFVDKKTQLEKIQ